jgi:hypothetical protein
LAVDDAGVQLPDDIVTEAQPLDCAGRHVFDGDVGLLQQLLDDLEPARRFEIESDRFFVGVELVEIPGIVVGLPGPQSPARIAGFGVLDLDDLGTEPSERLRTGGTGFELREIDDLDPFETIELYAVSVHLIPPPVRSARLPPAIRNRRV